MATVTRISSLDPEYKTGDLSLFPATNDDSDSLYEARNNAESILTHSLSYTSDNIIVEDARSFPRSGLLRLSTKGKTAISPEFVYYSSRNATRFSGLVRGFAGSIRSTWQAGITYVSNAVFAEHHNAVKDALINIETYLGTSENPAADSLNGRVKAIENKYLTSKPLWRAYPLSAQPGATIRFQNFSEGDNVRYLWDFGDGSMSTDKSPSHTYTQEGKYSVRMNIINSTGGQASSVKYNCITISKYSNNGFMYAQLLNRTEGSSIVEEYIFVDQSDMEVTQRIWIFDDGDTKVELDPDVHTVKHSYMVGTYRPSLFIVTTEGVYKKVYLSEEITVA